MSDILRLTDVQVRIAGSHILQGIDFTVPEGGVTALLGRNGVGKTTTLKAILGIVPATGNIEFDGHRIDEAPTHRIVRSGVGYVPEDRDVFASLTVEENLRLAEVPGVQPDYATVHDLFPELRDRRKQRAGTLSGGQQQMVALARVLLGPARLLLVDEPTKGLAPKLVAQVGDVLARVAERMGVRPSQVVLAWLLQPQPVIRPIVGVSSLEQLDSALSAVRLGLDDNTMQELDAPR